MDKTALNFLTEVLGTEGARALQRTAQKEPSLGSVLIPRAALAWIHGREGFEGRVPGVANSYLKFNKSEAGYAGIVTLPDVNYEFAGATAEHVAAALAVAVGAGTSKDRGVRDLTLMRLGKSIDVLVKAQAEVKKLTIVEESSEESEESPDMQKAGTERPGQTHRPTPQAGAIGPQAPISTQPGSGTKSSASAAASPGAKPKGLPKPSKAGKMGVTKSEMYRPCPDCGSRHFNGTQFKGCMCVREFAKYVKSTAYGDGVVLEFMPSFDRNAMLILRKALKD